MIGKAPGTNGPVSRHHSLDIMRCRSFGDVVEALSASLERHCEILPVSTSAKILLKPNLNSNMGALTGNTTDLRILSALVLILKERGYRNIVIGEGTNSGFYRCKIGVLSRLKIDALARYYGVEVRDLNYSDTSRIDFAGGLKAQAARECLEADLFINLPKLKTHFEVGMSVCLKNLIGCLVGQENKKKTHQNLDENILRLNQGVRPHLHIVDALVAMEGLGPSRGTPLRMDTIIVGTDPYLIDLACARIAGFDWRHVRTLRLADCRGLITAGHHDFVSSLNLEGIQRSFALPDTTPLARLVHSPRRQKYFLKIRGTSLFSFLASTGWFGRLLFLTGLRQDMFSHDEMSCEGLSLDKDSCNGCGVCHDVCPLGLDLPRSLHQMDEKCIQCLYCFFACPSKAIRFSGKLGFLREQLRQYDGLMMGLYR